MRFKLPILLLLTAAVIFVACKKEENFTSHISFVHGALGFPAISLKSDSTALFTSIVYDSLVQNQVTPSGTRVINLSATGVTPISLTTNLESNVIYTGVLYDTATSAKLYIRKDAIPAAPGEGRCQVRFFNMIKGSATLTLANDTFRYYGTAGAFANFASSNAFTEIDTLARPSIRVDSLRFVTRLPALRSGKIYSIFLTGRINDTITGLYKPKAIIQVHN